MHNRYHIRNLTVGDRTLDVQAVLDQIVIGDYQLSRVDVGYTLIRTTPFEQAVPAGGIVEIFVSLRDNTGSVLALVKSQAAQPQPVASYAVGVLAVI